MFGLLVETWSAAELSDHLLSIHQSNYDHYIEKLSNRLPFFHGITEEAVGKLYYVTASIESDIIGMVKLRKFDNNESLISYISISKRYRGKGISKLLIDRMFQYATELGIVSLEQCSYTYEGLHKTCNTFYKYSKRYPSIKYIDVSFNETYNY